MYNISFNFSILFNKLLVTAESNKTNYSEVSDNPVQYFFMHQKKVEERERYVVQLHVYKNKKVEPGGISHW